jgi:N-acyl homoserine lactone hydrolase
MKKPRKRDIALVWLLIAIVCIGWTLLPYPLPDPPAWTGTEPQANAPAGMALYQLPTGSIHRNAAFAYRGGSPFDEREFAMTAVLVRHPKGDFLIDTGFGRQVEEHFQKMPGLFRAMTNYEHTRSAATQLSGSNYKFEQLSGIILTHAHWDHVSGIPELYGTPVWVTTEERNFIENGGVLTRVIREFPDVKYHQYAFDSRPYLGFEKSYDVHGDGSIVIVPAPGHTPGSVIVFLTLTNKTRYAMIGDLAWQNEGVLERAERSWLFRNMADKNHEEVRQNLLRMTALVKRFPGLILVPAHEARGYETIPLLPWSIPER